MLGAVQTTSKSCCAETEGIKRKKSEGSAGTMQPVEVASKPLQTPEREGLTNFCHIDFRPRSERPSRLFEAPIWAAYTADPAGVQSIASEVKPCGVAEMFLQWQSNTKMCMGLWKTSHNLSSDPKSDPLHIISGLRFSQSSGFCFGCWSGSWI